MIHPVHFHPERLPSRRPSRPKKTRPAFATRLGRTQAGGCCRWRRCAAAANTDTCIGLMPSSPLLLCVSPNVVVVVKCAVHNNKKNARSSEYFPSLSPICYLRFKSRCTLCETECSGPSIHIIHLLTHELTLSRIPQYWFSK